ncbi:MAG: hypothetical protein KAS32_24245 [Candidatus Peribacteraceae bacterium]|nr:hypothetical protein [Candidatus Peribacteraceae bacterium]
MSEFTDLEKKVYNAAIDICEDEAYFEIKEIVAFTGLKANTVKGVIGSLVKKGKIQSSPNEVNFVEVQELIPLYEDEDGIQFRSFGCDSSIEPESLYLK